MHVLAHRGYWLEKPEQNTASAFIRALNAGYGIETDVRDSGGRLVISHDIPGPEAMRLQEFLELYCENGNGELLALNIKSDGLASHLATALQQFDITDYFCFDMSLPDSLAYIDAGMNTFLRRSEYESSSPLEPLASGVWFDGFNNTWFNEEQVLEYLDAGMDVALVSPELHHRKDECFETLVDAVQNTLANRTGVQSSGKCAICTDFPQNVRA